MEDSACLRWNFSSLDVVVSHGDQDIILGLYWSARKTSSLPPLSGTVADRGSVIEQNISSTSQGSGIPFSPQDA